MARNKVDPCMFCGEVPCVCNGKAKPARAPRKPKPVEVVTATVVDELSPPASYDPIKDAMRSAAKVSTAPPPVDHSADDLAAEIQVLADAGLLHEDELTRFAHLLNTVKTRAQAWKERNRGMAQSA